MFGQLRGWGGRVGHCRQKRACAKAVGRKEEQDNFCMAEAEGTQKEKLDWEPQPRIYKAMNSPTREFGLDPVVGKGEPLRNFKQGCDRTIFVFRKPSRGEME